MPMDETMGMARRGFLRTHGGGHRHESSYAAGRHLQSELVHDLFEGFARGARANVSCARVIWAIESSQG